MICCLLLIIVLALITAYYKVSSYLPHVILPSNQHAVIILLHLPISLVITKPIDITTFGSIDCRKEFEIEIKILKINPADCRLPFRIQSSKNIPVPVQDFMDLLFKQCYPGSMDVVRRSTAPVRTILFV